MKKLVIASALAVMCFSANAFAEDDGYGNDIPAARSEGTVDDGYGNKLPANNEPEYKSFEEARASSYGSTNNSSSDNQVRRSLLGIHMGLGFGGLSNYPADKDFIKQYGENEWFGFSFDIGLVFKYRLSPLVSFVPELNFGIGYLAEEIQDAGGYDSFWGAYKVNDTRTLYNINIPLILRLTVPFVYVEGGIRLNLNLTTDHEYEYTDRNGNPLKYIDEYGEEKTVKRDAFDEWKVKTFVPSVIGGLGTTFLINGHECDLGVRLIWDLTGIEENSKHVYKLENNKLSVAKLVEDDSSMFSIQLILNYFF